MRDLDRIGNNAADESADFGCRRVGFAVIDAPRDLSGVTGRWYPVNMLLHRFFIAIFRVVVNHDDGEGTAPDPLICLLVLFPRRRVVLAVRNHALLPGHASIRTSEWVNLPPSGVTAEDVGAWPYSVGILVNWVTFLGTLHWPADRADLGVDGFPMYELCAGERLVLQKAFLRYRRHGRPISVSLVPFGPGTDTWCSCRFIGALMRSLCLLPGGLGRFVPCSVGANHCRLWHIGWDKCGHGLTSRLRESASVPS